MSHVVSGAATSTWVKQQMPGSLSSLPRDVVSVCEGTETNCKVGRWDNVNDNVPEILGLFPEVMLPHWQMGISRSWAGGIANSCHSS